MKRSIALFGLCLPVLLAIQPATKPATKPAADHAAVVAYRAYVDVIRAGDIDKATALVEPVPADCAAALAASLRSAIAVEAVKSEMIKRMGPAKLEEEGWNMGQLPDEILNALHAGVEEGDAMLLMAKDPQDPNGNGYAAAAMVKRGGVWRVSASQPFGLEPTTPFVAPSKEDLDNTIKMAGWVTTGAGVVLKRLKAGEFEEPEAVQSAVLEEMQKAAGQ